MSVRVLALDLSGCGFTFCVRVSMVLVCVECPGMGWHALFGTQSPASPDDETGLNHSKLKESLEIHERSARRLDMQSMFRFVSANRGSVVPGV